MFQIQESRPLLKWVQQRSDCEDIWKGSNFLVLKDHVHNSSAKDEEVTFEDTAPSHSKLEAVEVQENSDSDDMDDNKEPSKDEETDTEDMKR